jgi:hypothetical protein
MPRTIESQHFFEIEVIERKETWPSSARTGAARDRDSKPAGWARNEECNSGAETVRSQPRSGGDPIIENTHAIDSEEKA